MIATTAASVLFGINREQVPPPSDVLVRFANRAIANRDFYRSDERRSEYRHTVALNVLAIPLDADFEQHGEPFTAITRNVSASGLAMFHSRNVNDKYLALEIGDPWGDRLRLIMSVRRSRHVGLFYEVAGPFVVKIQTISPTGDTPTPDLGDSPMAEKLKAANELIQEGRRELAAANEKIAQAQRLINESATILRDSWGEKKSPALS